jgi:hypothetical protein
MLLILLGFLDLWVRTSGRAGDFFGAFSVALDGDNAFVGAYGHDDNGSNSGSAYLFTRDVSGMWTQQAELLAADGVQGDRFGISIAKKDEILLIGAHNDDDNGIDSGSAYVFVRNTT